MRRSLILLTLAMATFPVCTLAQRGGSNGTIIVRIQNPDGSPFDGAADVSLSQGSTSAASSQLATGGKTEFHNLVTGSYYIDVKSQGYKNAEERVEVNSGSGDTQVWVKMEPDAESVAKPVAHGTLRAPKVQQVVDKGTEALKAGNFDEAKKQLEAAYTAAPGDPDVNYLLGYTFLMLKDFAQADVYLTRASSLDPRNISALLALGQLRAQQNNYSAAVVALQQAVALDANNYMSHWTLASAYLHSSQFEKARDEAAETVRTGKGAANGAEIIIGEAYAALGETDQAIAALQAFIRDVPQNSAVPAAKQMIEKLQASKNQPARTQQ